MKEFQSKKRRKVGFKLILKVIFWVILLIIGKLIYGSISSGTISLNDAKNYNTHDNKKALKVLFIGNSHTSAFRIDQLLMEISLSQKEQYYHIYAESVADAQLLTIKIHWEAGEALRAIKRRKWDYVVLQGQSAMPLDPKARANFLNYSKAFVKEINKTGAKAIFYGTWPYTASKLKKYRAELTKLNKGRFAATIKNFNPDLHYRAINSIYLKAAKKYKSTAVLTAPIRNTAPQDIALQENGNYNTLAGAYLNALAFYKHIFSANKFDEDTYVPVMLDKDDARRLRKHVENFGKKVAKK